MLAGDEFEPGEMLVVPSQIRRGRLHICAAAVVANVSAPGHTRRSAQMGSSSGFVEPSVVDHGVDC